MEDVLELFRRQALTHRQRQTFGEVVLAAPPMSWPIAGLLAIVVGCAAVALTIGERSRSESVAGRLLPSHGLIRLRTVEAGRVAALHVAEGDSVDAGAPLLTVTRDTSLQGGANFSTLTLTHLAQEARTLERRLQLAAHRQAAELASLSQHIAHLAIESGNIEKQIETHDERIALAAKLVARLVQLEQRGFVAELERLSRQDELIDLRSQRERLLQSSLQLKTQIATLRGRVEALPIERDERVAEIHALLTGNAQRRAEAMRQSHIVIRAPVAGRIAALPIQAGQALAPQSLQLALLPHDAELQAEIFVPSRAAGFIAAGQFVRLRYDAFPYQKFGSGAGRIRTIAASALPPRELAIEAASAEPVYRVIVALDADNIAVGDERWPLQAGMTLRADIVLEKRKLWEWLFEPLLALQARQ
jgi:membrane fusion protein